MAIYINFFPGQVILKGKSSKLQFR
jgi:hypothetical protein